MRTHEDVGKFAGRITRGDARMVNAEDLSPALRGKSRAQQLRLIQSIIDADRRGRFSLGPTEKTALAQFATRLQQGSPVDDALLLAVSTMVRHYEQHLIAISRGVR
jgi:hypothetical protein